MSEEISNQQTTTQYLLGALSEAETERFDELSIADDEFAGLLRTAEKDLVDAYVSGELTGARLQQFETHYLASPLRRENVHFARAFQIWALRNVTQPIVQDRSEIASERPGKRNWFSSFGFFNAPRLAGGLGLATLVLLVAIGLVAFQNARLRQQMMQAQAKHDELLQREQELQKEIETQKSVAARAEQELAQVRDERTRLEQEMKNGEPQPVQNRIVSLILPPPVRGAGQISTVSIRPGNNLVAARLELENADYTGYRVTLNDPVNNRILWRSGSLKPQARGEGKAISVSLSAALLKPQIYALRVTGVSIGGGVEIVGDYPFRVVKQ